MGVKGLTSFLRDNQQSLCRPVYFSQRDLLEADKPRTPVVVDGWSIIFSLWLSSLPWPSGGEYLRFYKLVCVLIESWRNVGLEPTFVFDGASPVAKHQTMMKRADDQIRSAQLFYSTSPTSRSEPSSRYDKVILPPLASHTFFHALSDMGVTARFIPLGEADAACVVLAEQLGAYVVSADSDFLVLISSPRLARLKGYCPLDMISWIEDDSMDELVQEEPGGDGGDGWQVAGSRAGPSQPRQRTSHLIPGPTLRRPKLVMTSVAPSALRQRLRIPANMLPVFASLVGNDYTPPEAVQHFFEPTLDHSGRIEKAARIIRETVYSPQQTSPKSSTFSGTASSSDAGSNAGDHAVGLVRKIVTKLCWKPFPTDGITMAMVEATIEATFQYTLPAAGECCEVYPFCREANAEECTTTSSLAASVARIEIADAANGIRQGGGRAAASKAYADAQKRGHAAMVVHVSNHPTRIYLWPVLEDPYGPSLRKSEGARTLRMKAYAITDEAVGLRWPELVETEDDASVDVDLIGSDPSTAAGIRAVATASSSLISDGEEDNLVTRSTEGSEGCKNDCENVLSTNRKHAGHDDSESSPAQPTTDPRSMVEYVRHTNHLMPFSAPLPLPPTDNGPFTCLQPLSDRLRIYLETLQSCTPTILALPAYLHPLVGIARFAAMEAHAGGPVHQWCRSEVEAVLRAFVGTYTAWCREKNAKAICRPATDLAWPDLTNRNCNIVAQISSVMVETIVLAQALLLLPHTTPQSEHEQHSGTNSSGSGVTKLPKSTTGSGRKMPTVTHLTPFVFFSGITLHTLLSRNKPVDWEWSPKEERIYHFCLRAFEDGLPTGVVKGWTVPDGLRQDRQQDGPKKVMSPNKSGKKFERYPAGPMNGRHMGDGGAGANGWIGVAHPKGWATAAADWRKGGSSGRFDVLRHVGN